MISLTQVHALVEAALDQPQPTRALKKALAPILKELHHPDRVRDPRELDVDDGCARRIREGG